jgi:hypothetical protein
MKILQKIAQRRKGAKKTIFTTEDMDQVKEISPYSSVLTQCNSVFSDLIFGFGPQRRKENHFTT